MNMTPIINQFLHVFFYLLPIIIIIGLIKSPWFKGIIGEAIVNFSSKMSLNKDEYHLLKNVTLPTRDGTTQIDHIIVSKYGIFVIETKNMKGWIFGNPRQKTWTQKIYKHTNTFQNPLHQNYKHVKTLESFLGIPENKIHSVIVFAGDSTFKTKMPENVVQTGGHIKFIKSKRQAIFSDKETNEIVASIKSGRLSPTLKTHVAHVKHVQSIVDSNT